MFSNKLVASPLKWNWTFLLALLTQFAYIFAADTSSPSQPISDDTNLSIGAIIAGVILIVIGLVFTFFGQRILKFIIFLAGALLLAYLTLLVAANIIDFATATDSQKIGIYVAMGVLGLMGGFLALCIWQLGLLLLGGCLGAAIGSLIARTNVIQTQSGQTILIVVCAIVFAILTFMLSNIFVIIATSFFGSITFMCGVDEFAQAGFASFLNQTKDNVSVAPTAKVWAMIGSTVVIGIIGILVQLKTKKAS